MLLAISLCYYLNVSFVDPAFHLDDVFNIVDAVVFANYLENDSVNLCL
jgi:hypothetical protein